MIIAASRFINLLNNHFNRFIKGKNYMFSDKYRSVCESAAQRLTVNPEIHSDDFIFRFVFENPSFESREQAIEYYFNDGANSARKLRAILTDICGFNGKRLHLLEFASGYGCVTRHIKNVIPFCLTTSCDIHEAAVRFIKGRLGQEAVISTSRPEDLYLNQSFDVVFALSFFSHMPKSTFTKWLNKLASFVKPEGYFIFTTHGLLSRVFFHNCKLDKDGFYFSTASEQKDLNEEEYGCALVKPQYVFDRIFEIPNITLRYFHEGYWWGHQDVYIFKKVERS
jgi:2-polyprenyl-3-methyl-5-hydroxy-6-metoxy-1,4-benzoquinol methylase